MEEWLKISIFVSLFASFRDFRPVDSFYASYLTSPAVNFTVEQVSWNRTQYDVFFYNKYYPKKKTHFIVLIIFE